MGRLKLTSKQSLILPRNVHMSALWRGFVCLILNYSEWQKGKCVDLKLFSAPEESQHLSQDQLSKASLPRFASPKKLSRTTTYNLVKSVIISQVDQTESLWPLQPDLAMSPSGFSQAWCGKWQGERGYKVTRCFLTFYMYTIKLQSFRPLKHFSFGIYANNY